MRTAIVSYDRIVGIGGNLGSTLARFGAPPVGVPVVPVVPGVTVTVDDDLRVSPTGGNIAHGMVREVQLFLAVT